MGYNLEKSDNKTIIKEILSLLHLIKKFNKKIPTDDTFSNSNENIIEFPIISYQYLILDYFKNGYYCEKEVAYSTANNGKINWKRTLQNKKPYISDNKAIYLNFIVNKNIINTNNILTKIYEYCLYESFLKIGWLYTEFLPMKPKLKFNQKMFTSILNDKISKTFNDTKKQLFIAMLNIVKNINKESSLNKECFYGTNSFEYIWERMIDYVFVEPDKEIYFPKIRWNLVSENNKIITKSSLKPDTIIKLYDKVYIIDAKYYKYGITECSTNLPDSSSIQKQITYGEYLTSDKFKEIYGQVFNNDKIYNAFIMPFNKNKYNDNNYKFIGIATADWKNSYKQYENVTGILLDTKYLMSNYYEKNYSEIEKLSKLIQTKIIT